MTSDHPTVRWGIIATGAISTHFVRDISLDRVNPAARHIIQAIGSSSREKGAKFAAELLPGKQVTIYDSYDGCYHDPNVDVVYIGTPHAFHKQNCLAAIRAGKHVLCEKPFTINAKEADEVCKAAERQGVYVLEGVWTRHFPLVKTLQRLLHEEHVIGDVNRVFCDFSFKMDIESLDADSRLKNRALGAGSLLDIGVYSLTWALVGLDAPSAQKEIPKIMATQKLVDGVDAATSALLLWPNGKQAIITSSTEFKTPAAFCRLEGSQGFIVVEGPAASVPAAFTVHTSSTGVDWVEVDDRGLKMKRFSFERVGRGFYFEADAVALDIQARRTQSPVLPWSETARLLKIMDEIRRQGGGLFPQD